MARTRLRLLAIVVGAALLAACPEDAASPDASSAPAAHLQKVLGKVTVERGGQTRAAELGYLYAGDALETGPDGEAVVRFGGGRMVEMGPDARFVIAAQNGGLVLEVARGLVLTRVPSAAAAKSDVPTVELSILTPFGLTRVGSGGNSVSVDVKQDGARVEVLAGQVELISRNGKATRAEEGAKAVLGVGDVELTGRKVELTPMPVEVVSLSGRAELRRKDKKRWELVGKGATLASGDSVRGKDGKVSLRPQGGKLQLGLSRGGEVTLVDSGRSDVLEQAKVELAKGTLELELPPSKSRVVVGKLALESDLGGRFSVVKTADGLEVSSFTGDVRAKAGDAEEKLVRAGERAKVKDAGAVETSALSRPELVLPAKMGLRVFHPGLDDVLLTWEGETQDYRLVVASDPGFTQPVLTGRVHDRQAVIPAPQRGTLHWKVLAANGDTEVAKGSATFAPEAPLKDLARARNEVQDGSDKTSIYFQDKPPAVTFRFKKEDGAVKYRLRVFRPGAFDTPVAEKTGAGEEIALEAGALGEGGYLWDITPLDAKGEPVRGGKMNKLEITYDNSVPSIVVKTPRNGDVVKGNTLAVAGVAPLGTKVFANGKALPLDAKHRFEGQASPVGQPPLIIFRTARANGAEVFTVRTLRRAR